MVKFKLLQKKETGVESAPVSPVKTGIRFDNLKWKFEDDKTIISIDATKLGVTVSVKDLKIKKNPKILNRLEGCIRIVENVAKTKLEKKLAEQKR